MKNISKLIGAVVGGALGFAVSNFGLPADLATPEIVASITALLASVFVYFFPANKPA
ncbi:MAG: hypothetical protein AAF737_04725 [Pseudomonadota bacterium]